MREDEAGTPPRALGAILDSMAAIRKSEGEYEHMEADSLLVEALRYLGGYFSPFTREQIGRIIEEYDSIRKWYA